MDADITESPLTNITGVTTDITTVVLNEMTAYVTTHIEQMTSESHGLRCDEKSRPCVDMYRCNNHGLCCWNEHIHEYYCVCHIEWTGKHCESRDTSSYDYAEESRERKLAVIGMSSIISLIIGLLALIAFVVLAVLLIRKKLFLRQTDASIEQNLTEIEEELNKMPTVTKLKHLTRLSKKFEASARATVEEAIQTAAVMDSLRLGSPLSQSAHDYLPRWSSAPSHLQTSTPVPSSVDVPDGPMNGFADNGIPLNVIERRKLQQVFSHPV